MYGVHATDKKWDMSITDFKWKYKIKKKKNTFYETHKYVYQPSICNMQFGCWISIRWFYFWCILARKHELLSFFFSNTRCIIMWSKSCILFGAVLWCSMCGVVNALYTYLRRIYLAEIAAGRWDILILSAAHSGSVDWIYIYTYLGWEIKSSWWAWSETNFWIARTLFALQTNQICFMWAEGGGAVWPTAKSRGLY